MFSLNSIILYVYDVDRLKTFYTDIFKMQIIEEDPSVWVLLEAGNCQLGLHRIGDTYRSNDTPPRIESNAKIVFNIDGDIITVREELENKGVVMRQVKTFEDYDYWLCDGEDPEGNVFQLRMKKK